MVGINIVQLLMASQVKKHRRNQAVGQEEETFRMSVPVIHCNISRNSFETQCQPIPIYRSSDLAQLPVLSARNRQPMKKKELSFLESQGQKTEKKLLSTFNHLQQKLELAKQQLTQKDQKQLCQFSFELNNYKEESKCSRMGLEASLCEKMEKMEESTINLESNKKLINAVRSKERLILANKIKGYYLKEVAKGIIGINQRAAQHLSISHQIMRSSEEMELPDETMIPRKRVQLKIDPDNIGKKVMVLDLDQTLFHCEESRMSEEDWEIKIPMDNSSGFQYVYISLRPYALSFLKKAKKNFQIIAFTASEKSYADAILDEIDPDYQYISHRLYREHCVKLQNRVYAKDLSIINRDLSKMILVDNSPLSYLYQIENGVPILPYYGGEDCELLALEKYLDKIKVARDVRGINVRMFKLHQYGRFQDCQTLVKQLYCNGGQA